MLGIVVQAILFSIAHGYHQTVAEIAYKFTFGLVMGWVVVKRKTVLPTVVAHSITDITAGIISVLL